MSYFVVDTDTGKVKCEAESYEEAFLKMCHFQREQGAHGIYIEYEIVPAEKTGSPDLAGGDHCDNNV